jgi:predicted lipid-binding transport protein (Tim44 family)
MSGLSRIVLMVVLVVAGSAWLMGDAEAKRLGSSRSFGMQRDSGAMRQASPPPAAPATPSAPNQAAPAPQPSPPVATPQAPRPNRWLGPLAGLAAGIGLAALFSHLGLSPGLGNLVMVALLAGAGFLVFRLLFRRSQPAYHGLSPVGGAPLPGQSTADFAAAGTAQAANVPPGFDVEGFLRQAKLNFIRLQAANDAGNLDDLRQFLAPEVFAEIQLEYEGRGKTRQETDVQHLEAQLLEVITEDNRYIASVRFSGLIREDAGAAEPFAEVWHLLKPVSGERGWQVAGIQQLA